MNDYQEFNYGGKDSTGFKLAKFLFCFQFLVMIAFYALPILISKSSSFSMAMDVLFWSFAAAVSAYIAAFVAIVMVAVNKSETINVRNTAKRMAMGQVLLPLILFFLVSVSQS